MLFISAAYILVFGFWLVNLVSDLTSKTGAAHSIVSVLVVVRLGGVLMMLVCVLLPVVPGLVGMVAQEKMVAVLSVYTNLCILDKFYMAKLLGHSDPSQLFPEVEGYTDCFLLLSICLSLIVCHVTIPLRWCLLVAAEVAPVAVYGAIVFVLGSPEPYSRPLFGYLSILVVLIAIGKRQAEVNERLVFSSFLAEKTLRMQAEYQLSQATHQPRGDAAAEDASSVAPTTATAEAFGALGSGEARPYFETIVEVGRREQWLIDEQELSADPDACVGLGGFGVVVAGSFHASPVVLKFHRSTGNAKPLADIGNELRLMRKLRHPNIVLFHGACLSVERNDIVLVMERVFGERLSSFIAHEPEEADRRSCLADICRALMYLHSRRPAVLHGDLKPDNLMVENHGLGIRVKLLDFGLARLVTRSARVGGGTFRWMAPGALRRGGSPELADDAYALGLVMFFAATGHKPFESSGERMLKAIACGRYGGAHPALDWPLETSGLSAQCRPIVASCTHPSCGERLSVAQVLELLSVRDEVDCKADAAAPQGPPPSPVPADLWETVSKVRRSADRRRTAQRSGHLSEQRGEPSDPVAVGRLAPVTEQHDPAQDAEPPDFRANLRVPGLQSTPKKAMLTDLLLAMQQWNSPVRGGGHCCLYHGSVGLLRELCAEMQGFECTDMEPEEGGLKILQCLDCLRLAFEDGDGADFECETCGGNRAVLAGAQ